MEGGHITVRDRSGAEAKDVALDAFVRELVEEAGSRSLQQSRFGD
jgi:hypothetical protein